MSRSHWIGLIIVTTLCVTALFGCQQRPAVPTVAPAPTEPVVVIVITATSQPTLAPSNTPEATITPLATFTPVTFETVTPTVQATLVTQATLAPVTAAPPQPTAEVPPTEGVPPTVAIPTNFVAPAVFAPEDTVFRDGNTLKLEFSSVGPLAPDQCYRFDMTLAHPTGPGGVGDYWVPMAFCGNQSAAGERLVLELKPGRFRDEPNYGQLLIDADNPANIPPTPEYVMQWFVTVVRLLDATDSIHPTVESLSPPSASLQNKFSR